MHPSGSLTALVPITALMSHFLLFSSCFLGTGVAAAHPGLVRRADIASIIEKHVHKFSPNTSIYLPSSPEFFNITERWTTFDAPTFNAAISPATEEDVVKSVRQRDIEAAPGIG